MECSTPVIEPCVPCKHPFEYLFENAYLATLGLENKVSFAEALIGILEQGLFIPNCNTCCPDCGTYVLTNVETFLLYAEAAGSFNYDCCLNVLASTETELKLIEGAGLITSYPLPNNCCNTNFSNCFNKLYCWLNKPEGSAEIIDRILDAAIVEYGAFYDQCNNKSISGLCYISEFLKKYCNLNIGTAKIEFITQLLDIGIIIACEEDRIIIASVQTYLQYAEAVGN